MDDREALWLTEADQIAQGAGVAARALRDDPDWRAISDDPVVRLEMLRGLFAASLEGARVAGVRLGDRVVGVASAVEPGQCVGAKLPPEVRTLEPPSDDASDSDRLMHFRSILAAHDLDEPHWHVGPVGVEPGFQSLGIGGAAMRFLCEEFDEYGRVSWLKTAKPENVGFYAGHGFDVVEESWVLAVPLWFMRRQPH